MAHPRIKVGMDVVAKAPLGGVEVLVSAAQDLQLASVFIWEHLQDFFPSAICDEDFAWFAAESPSPMSGSLAPGARGSRCGGRR